MKDPCPTCGAPPARQVVAVCLVSKHVHELIRANETAAMEMQEASGTDNALTAYAHVTVARESLYEYVSDLERRCRVVRDQPMRF